MLEPLVPPQDAQPNHLERMRRRWFVSLRDIAWPRSFRELPAHAFDPVTASVLFQVAFLVSAALGIVRQMLFNAQFGAGPDASAYVAAFRLPETLLNLIGGGALGGAMIPVLLRTAREDGAEAERHLVNLVLTVMGVVMLAAAAVAIVFAGPFVRHVLAPGFDMPTSERTITLTRLMLLEPPLIILTTVAMAVLSTRNQFFLTALSVALHNVILISGILIARVVPGVGIYGPTVGLVLDGVLQAAILLPGLRMNGFRFRPAWDLANRRLRQVVGLLVPSGLSAITNYSGTIIDTAAASLTYQAAALPALSNAFLLIGLPIRLLGQAIGQSIFPRVAAHAAMHEWRGMRVLLVKAFAVAIGLALPATVAFVVLGRWMVRVLFERGAFDANAAALTASVLAVYALGLPFYIGTELITRGHAALYDTRTPLLTNILQVVGRIGIITWLLGPLGVLAIPLAFAMTSAAETVVLGVVLWARLRRRTTDDRPPTTEE